MELKRNRLVKNKTRMPVFFFFLFILFFFCSLCALFSASSTTSTAGLDSRRRLSAKGAGHTDLQHQTIVNCPMWQLDMEKADAVKPGDDEQNEEDHLRLARRGLGGPGSSPPRCASKCGKCTPCKAVHVPVPPGTPVTAEYYPEAWRCKCGNKLYMP